MNRSFTRRRQNPDRQSAKTFTGQLAAAEGRALGATSLLRRCGRIAWVAGYRSARVTWFAAVHMLGHDVDESESFPHQLRLAFEDLGPTFVKLGQLLSARSDITPPEVQQEMLKLRDHASAIPHADLVDQLEHHIGSKSSDIFAAFDIAPTACGSIAQVHKGTLHDGRHVAVKVRRPGVRSEIEADMWWLRLFVRAAEFVSSRARAYDLVAIIDGFASLLRAESDLLLEASNLEAVGRALASNDAVTVPRVLKEMSSEQILVMDWIDGLPLTDLDRLDALGFDRPHIAKTILEVYGVMIFQSDRFQADPHPGNLIAAEGGRLGLVDFGEVGSITPSERSALLGMMAAVLGRDGEALAAAVLSVSRTTRALDSTAFGTQLTALLRSVADANLETMRLGETLGRLLHLVRTNGIILPADLAILIKTLIECEATTSELDPTMSILTLVAEISPGFSDNLH